MAGVAGHIKESDFEHTYDKVKPKDQETSTSDTHTVIKKSHGRCSSTNCLKYLAAAVVTSIATAALVMSVVNWNQQNNTTLMTDKQISSMNNNLTSLLNRLADLELNNEELRDNFRESSQNNTLNAILQLSIQVNNSREQIERLNEVIREMAEQQNSSKRQIDELLINVYELEQRQNQTEEQIRVHVDNLRNDVGNRIDEIENSTLAQLEQRQIQTEKIRADIDNFRIDVGNRFDEIENSTPAKSELHQVETDLSNLESRVHELELSSGVVLMSKYSLVVGLVTVL